ncbi:hypothetical protein ACH427_16760 [Streptomyces sp. NPDC020379]|uniref:hypothetical protein n=1 Tax=Streptomyces sp. NPDC020379 TaxID=3365071 RepID=UPI00378EA86B
MTTHPITRWATANPWPTLAAVVLLLVLVAAVVWWLRRLWDTYLGSKPLAVRFGILAALGCSGASIDTSWRYARDHLHIDVIATRIAVFGGAEILLVAMALFARHQLLGSEKGKKAVGGGAGIGVWVLSSLLCVPAFSEFGVGGGAVRTIFGPIGAAIAMHKTVLTELQERDPEAEQVAERLVRTLRDKVLARLGLADLDQDAQTIARNRALAHATELVEQLAGLPAISTEASDRREKREARRQKRRRTALLAELRTALREAGVRPPVASTDPIDVLLADLAVARHAEALLELKTVSPWQRQDPAAHELAQQVRQQWTTADQRIRSTPLSAAERLAQRGLPLPAPAPGGRLFADVKTITGTTDPAPSDAPAPQPEPVTTAGNREHTPGPEPVPAPPAPAPDPAASEPSQAAAEAAGEPAPADHNNDPEPVPGAVPAAAAPAREPRADTAPGAAPETTGGPVPADGGDAREPEPQPVPVGEPAEEETVRELVPVGAVPALGAPRLRVTATLPDPAPGTREQTVPAPGAEAVPAQTGTGSEPPSAPSGEPVPGTTPDPAVPAADASAGTAADAAGADGPSPAGTGSAGRREPVPGDEATQPGTGPGAPWEPSAGTAGTGDGDDPGTGPGEAPEPADEGESPVPETETEAPSDTDREPDEDDAEASVPDRYRHLVPALVELLDKAKRNNEKAPTVAAVAREFRIRKVAAGPLLRHAKARAEQAEERELART